MGDSRGRWEGETLVADVVHFTDQTWFERSGNYHSAALHVVERYTRTSPDHILYEATIEDPKVFSRPWKISLPLYRRRNATCGFWGTSATCISRRRRTALRDRAGTGQRAVRTALTWKLKGWPT
jgi:hypothetical protein